MLGRTTSLGWLDSDTALFGIGADVNAWKFQSGEPLRVTQLPNTVRGGGIQQTPCAGHKVAGVSATQCLGQALPVNPPTCPHIQGLGGEI